MSPRAKNNQQDYRHARGIDRAIFGGFWGEVKNGTDLKYFVQVAKIEVREAKRKSAHEGKIHCLVGGFSV